MTLPDIPEAQSVARQDLPKTYWQNGYVDVICTSTILEKHSMVGETVLGIEIDEPVFDIDYPEDVARVEEGLRRLKRGCRSQTTLPSITGTRFRVVGVPFAQRLHE